MGGRREVSIISYRPVTRSDLKQERSFFRGSVSTFLQLVVAESLRSFLDKLGKGIRKEERGKRKEESEKSVKCHETWFRSLSTA